MAVETVYTCDDCGAKMNTDMSLSSDFRRYVERSTDIVANVRVKTMNEASVRFEIRLLDEKGSRFCKKCQGKHLRQAATALAKHISENFTIM